MCVVVQVTVLHFLHAAVEQMFCDQLAATVHAVLVRLGSQSLL